MKWIYVPLLFLLHAAVWAQDSIPEQPERRWDMLTYDLGNIFGGIGYAYTRPLHWQGDDWARVGGVVAGAALIYLVDTPVSDYFMDIKEDVPKAIRDYGFEYGSPANNYMITGAVYITGLATRNEKLRRTGVLLISSASAAGFLQQFFKSAVGRARPLSGLSKDTFSPLWSGDKDFHSFPSGHAILAFSNAYAIAKQFRNPWVKAGIYTVGMVPGISRLWEGKHWLSDVALSVAVSIFTVEAIDRYLDRKYAQKYNEQADGVQLDLQVGPGRLGLVLRF